MQSFPSWMQQDQHYTAEYVQPDVEMVNLEIEASPVETSSQTDPVLMVNKEVDFSKRMKSRSVSFGCTKLVNKHKLLRLIYVQLEHKQKKLLNKRQTKLRMS